MPKCKNGLPYCNVAQEIFCSKINDMRSLLFAHLEALNYVIVSNGIRDQKHVITKKQDCNNMSLHDTKTIRW